MNRILIATVLTVYLSVPAQMYPSNNSVVRIQSTTDGYTLKAENAPLREVLTQLAAEMNRQLVFGGDCEYPVSASIKVDSFEGAIRALLRGSSCTYAVDGDVFIVARQDVDTLLYKNLLDRELYRAIIDDDTTGSILLPERLRTMAIPLVNRDMIGDELIILDHVSASEAVLSLPAAIRESYIKVDRELNGVLVSGTSAEIIRIKKALEALDRPRPQVGIDVLLVEYSENVGTEMGMEFESEGPSGSSFSSPGVDVTLNESALDELFSFRSLDFLGDDFFLRLKALVDEGKADILAKPSISVVNGHEARVNVGQTSYHKVIGGTSENPTYRFQPLTYGISLKIRPVVTGDGMISAEIEPEIANTSGLNSEGLPNVFTRNIVTSVRIEEGKTLVLGGLVSQEETKSRRKVPALGNIPILGFFFRSSRKRFTRSNLFIYITPRIIETASDVSVEQYEKKLKSTKFERFLEGLRD